MKDQKILNLKAKVDYERGLLEMHRKRFTPEVATRALARKHEAMAAASGRKAERGRNTQRGTVFEH